MNNIEEYDERIEKFLRGDMSPIEEAEFKDDLAADPNLQERAKIVSTLIRGMKRKGYALDKAVLDESAPKYRISKRRVGFIAIVTSIAAVVLVMFNLTVLHSPNRNDILFTDNYTVYTLDSETRGDEEPVTVAELTELFNSIGTTDDCSDIIKHLEAIYASLDDDITYRMYATDVAWYLSLAYIKNNQEEKAIPVLQKLVVENPDTEIADKAQKLLDQLK